jgi:hypothetical protein
MKYSRLQFTSLAGLSIALAMSLAGGAPKAFANNTVYLYGGAFYGQPNPYQYRNGGEFTAFTTGLSGPLLSGLPTGSEVPAGYSTAATMNYGNVNGYPNLTGFETFCVEDQVDFNVGYSYSYTEGFAIQQTNGYLTAGAAWLYEKFATGQLGGFNYANTGPGASRLKDAGELQSALFFLEGEPANPLVFPNPTPANNVFLAEVEEYFGHGSSPTDLAAGLALAEANITSLGNDPYDVEVLELGTAQDQLIYLGTANPPRIPDSAETAVLLGFSLVALLALRRRSAQTA